MISLNQLLASALGIALVSAICDCFFKDQTMKHLMRLIAAISLITCLISAAVDLDFSSYASSLQTVRQSCDWDSEAAEAQNQSMNRMLIESECSAYILNRAANLQIPISQAHVAVQWDTQGYWVPKQAEITLQDSSVDTAALQDAIAAELGIPIESQIWSVANEG